MASEEVSLPTWQTFAAEDPLEVRAVEQMLAGVTTRRCEQSLEASPAELPAHSTI